MMRGPAMIKAPASNLEATAREAAHRLTRIANRVARVYLLLMFVTVLSTLDLFLTLHQMQASGMAEANPIVVKLLAIMPSAWTLAAYKTLSVGVWVGLQVLVRRTLVGELGAWLAAAILIGVIVAWFLYLQIVGIDGFTHVQTLGLGDWVVLR